MKRQIRRNVFETNSSSMHSLTVTPNGNMDNLIVDEYENKVITEFGEFGWGYDSYCDAATKLSYLMTMIIELNRDCSSLEDFYELADFKRVSKVVSSHCHCDGIKVVSNIGKCSWNDNYNDLLQKDNTLEYLYGEYMECDTANIQDVIIDFMCFDKGYYEYVNE